MCNSPHTCILKLLTLLLGSTFILTTRDALPRAGDSGGWHSGPGAVRHAVERHKRGCPGRGPAPRCHQPAIGTDASRLAEIEESLWEEVSVSQHCVWQAERLSDAYLLPLLTVNHRDYNISGPLQQYYKNSGEVYYRALSGFDTAVWDALAKRQKDHVCLQLNIPPIALQLKQALPNVLPRMCVPNALDNMNQKNETYRECSSVAENGARPRKRWERQGQRHKCPQKIHLWAIE